MRLWVERVRWGLIAGALVLVLVLAAFLGLGRYRAVQAWRRIVQRSGVSITHETNGFTYSQSVQGKTIFTLHAAKAVQHGDGKWSLHDVVLTLYGRVEGSADRIYGSDFEYDEKAGVARALGEVHMDLQAPQALASPHPAAHSLHEGAEPDEGQYIHVRTSGLVYVRKFGVAATQEPVEFRYGTMQCTSRGAEFNSGQSTLHLLADVRVNGEMHDAPLTVTANSADIDRTANVATLAQAVMYSQGRTAKADHVVGYLRKDSSLDRAEATGNVEMTSGTQVLRAARLDATLNAQSIPQHARLSGGVSLIDTNTLRPMQGSAQTVEVAFDAEGAPTNIVSSGTAAFSMVDHGGSGPALKRQVTGDRIVANFVRTGRKTRARLSDLDVSGSAKAQGDSLLVKPKEPMQMKTTHLSADDLHALFVVSATGGAQLTSVHGAGHTVLEQDAPLGEQQVSSGDQLEISFANEPQGSAHPAATEAVKIASAVQAGHATIRTRAASNAGSSEAPAVTTANADRAVYDGPAETLALSGQAHFSDGSTSLTAASVVLDQKTGNADAQGHVLATLQQATTSPGAQATHVMSDSAKLQHEAKLAEFRGSDAEPARLWQGASQVEAANLYFDGERRTLAARPAASGALVHAVFAGTPATKPGSAPAPHKTTVGGDVVRVASQRMDYADKDREVTFAGNVRLDGALGNVRSQRAVVLLNPAPKSMAQRPVTSEQPNPFSGSLDRVIVSGAVQLEQPGRKGSGDQLLYSAGANNFVLTGTPGHPPHMEDAQQGSVTGATLLFGEAGSTIVVAGETGSPRQDSSKPGVAKPSRGRVRTEAEIQK